MPTIAIVGSGIAGGALACVLAERGDEVLLLERTIEYTDHVRGEYMHPWGVAEVQRLGLMEVFERAGGRIIGKWQRFSRYTDEPDFLPIGRLLAGVPGNLNVSHPGACQALFDEAAARGATALRGVVDVHVTPGTPPTIAWSDGTGAHEQQVDLVVAADGRGSSVRRRLGIEIERTPSTVYLAGLLLDDLVDVPRDTDFTAFDDELYLLVFHQRENRSRAYLGTGLSARGRLSGPGATQAFLDLCRGLPLPWADSLAEATPAGPFGAIVGDHAWVREPYRPGVVLAGDAAGYTNPILGEGLSLAMRDARHLSELLTDRSATPPALTPAALDDFARRRGSDMDRIKLMAEMLSVLAAEDCENREARHRFFRELGTAEGSRLAELTLGIFTGPETVPVEAIDWSLPDRLRAVG